MAALPLLYRVTPVDLRAHLFAVQLRIAAPQAQQILALPVWIPGSYLVREFAKNLQGLRATQAGQPVAVVQRDKHSWSVHCQPGVALEVCYEVCAYDASVRMAWLDSERGFFNGTSLCLQVQGQEQAACELELLPPPKGQPATGWQCATSLQPVKVNRQGFGRYRAAHYDELVDSPVEMGAFWSGSFTACGVPHRFIVAGAPASFDGERLLADTRKICETTIRFWHGRGKPPHDRYVFMLNATHDGYGGLEHQFSTALICARRDLPRLDMGPIAEDGYTSLLGLICHEYFHTWNVKRLRPAEFARYDYAQENYTELLWFFEGFTSYYDDLLLRRAGLVDDAGYLKLLNKAVQQVAQTPGQRVQSVAQSSFDAWVKYYRQDENTPNATVSYYTKGSLVALCLDLTLRAEGKTSLDAVMRALWKRCQGGPMSETDVLAVLHKLSGRDWQAQLQAWVHGTDDLPLEPLLAQQGVRLQSDTATPAQCWGLRVQESHSVQVRAVLRGSPAEELGLMAGDEWWGVEVQGQGWRLQKLEELKWLQPPDQPAVALVARDRRILRLPMSKALPQQAYPVALPRLQIENAATVKGWLEG